MKEIMPFITLIVLNIIVTITSLYSAFKTDDKEKQRDYSAMAYMGLYSALIALMVMFTL